MAPVGHIAQEISAFSAREGHRGVRDGVEDAEQRHGVDGEDRRGVRAVPSVFQGRFQPWETVALKAENRCVERLSGRQGCAMRSTLTQKFEQFRCVVYLG